MYKITQYGMLTIDNYSYINGIDSYVHGINCI